MVQRPYFKNYWFDLIFFSLFNRPVIVEGYEFYIIRLRINTKMLIIQVKNIPFKTFFCATSRVLQK